jgi:hypothetical protein
VANKTGDVQQSLSEGRTTGMMGICFWEFGQLRAQLDSSYQKLLAPFLVQG